MNGYAVLLVYIAIVVVSIIIGIFISHKVVKKYTKLHFTWIIIIGIFVGLFGFDGLSGFDGLDLLL